MLKQAFNTLTRLHSRPATLKRYGEVVDQYSPIRVTPSNYFRFLAGPSSTTIHGREFIIPVDTIIGVMTQRLSFSAVPTDGAFIVTYDGSDSGNIVPTDVAANVQTILRNVPGLEAVTVTGNFTSGFTVVMANIQTPLQLIATKTTGDELDADITVVNGRSAFSPLISKADKIIHDIHGLLAIDEVIEMPDVGGDIMGYRVRCE